MTLTERLKRFGQLSVLQYIDREPEGEYDLAFAQVLHLIAREDDRADDETFESATGFEMTVAEALQRAAGIARGQSGEASRG